MLSQTRSNLRIGTVPVYPTGNSAASLLHATALPLCNGCKITRNTHRILDIEYVKDVSVNV